LANDPKGIFLTEEMLPKDVHVLRFDPGRLLRIALPTPLSVKITFFVLSLPVYLVGPAIFTYAISQSILDLPAEFSVLMVASAIALCALVAKRGETLTILLAERSYRIGFFPGKSRPGTPKIELSTSKIGGHWACELSIVDYPVATNVSYISAVNAEAPFRDFVLALSRKEESEDAHAEPPKIAKSNSSSEDGPHNDAADRLAAHRAPACPLIILVHGTWGTKSSWAIPEQSRLVRALRGHLPQHIEFRRFCWSGANRSSARARAADRLAEQVRSELRARDRAIFVLAHSHGGNIALRALEALSEEDRRNVQTVLMGTPFLSSGRHFDVLQIYEVMPASIRWVVIHPSIYWFGYGFLAYIAIGGLQRHFIDETHRISAMIDLFQAVLGALDDATTAAARSLLVGQFQAALGIMHDAATAAQLLLAEQTDLSALWLMLLMMVLFLLPIILFFILRKEAQLYAARPQIDSEAEQKHILRDRTKFLVITYSQDEAFQVLSFLINFLSLIHHIFFVITLALARLTSRIKLLEHFMVGLSALMVVFLILSFVGFSAAVLLKSMANAWPILQPLIGVALSIWDHIYKTMNAILGIVIGLAIVAGIIVVTVAASILIMGVFRIGIFALIGVMDQIRDRASFLNSVLGTVSISMIPVGRSEALMLEGRTLFNHVKIYDDEQTINRVAVFIRDALATRAELQMS
jgi:pimeloyl-ACP methyl ester carboxylesterase